MLTIRKEQMAVLSAYSREGFILKTLQKLPKVFPEDPKAKEEAAMRPIIEAGIARAAAYGIGRERETSLFIFLVKDLGPDFEKHPSRRWMLGLLQDPEMDEQEKMNLIYKRLEIAAGPS
ncbi:MAG: hypothetical protein HZA90_09040 [Verrucomicrobia bacterium]|nr:hypothetical protein [Verrucomicrobiota bacterium]